MMELQKLCISKPIVLYKCVKCKNDEYFVKQSKFKFNYSLVGN